MSMSSYPRLTLRGYTMKGYTIPQAYELGYQLAYRAELLSDAADQRGHGVAMAVLRTAEAMRLAVEAVVTGGELDRYNHAASFAAGSVAGYEAARATIAARVEGEAASA